MDFLIKISNSRESKKLWGEVRFDGINVLDAGNEILVYGNADPAILTLVLKECQKHGEPFIFYGGGG